jgi:primosomal protein N' (replication factor Y)
LIIVDEEHDTSYKQTEPAPRYHARETAVMLALQYWARMVLGSATPSLESLYNCMGGRFIRISLKERFFHGNDAEVEVIDTVEERRKRGMIGHFSRKLIAHIQKALQADKQVFILRSRRSYAPLLQCHECGEMATCPQCSVKLSWHQDTGRMVCHYCGYSEPYTGHCPSCGGELISLGAGTQKIEEEARELFPQAQVARLDSDTAQQAGYTRNLLNRFEKGEIDILVGTQIITKGFDFERLALVAVIGADTLLGQPDFRSDEKAFQLLEQFRGRCGRRGAKGLFVIQTAQSGHPVYRNLSSLTGTESMLPERKNFGYPPFTRLILILLKDSNLKRLTYLADELARLLGVTLGPEVRISGPYAPAIDKIAGQYFRHIRLTMAKDKHLGEHKKLLAETLAAFEKERSWNGHFAIDVDPV